MVLLGPDISHYQAGIDFSRVAADGMQFVLGKISQGSTSHDLQWPLTRVQALAAGLVICGYHYVSTDNVAAQAANCASHIGDTSIPVALDWETGGGNFANLTAVTAAFRAAGLHVALVYTGAWYWQQVGSPNMASLGLPLWKSRYPSTSPGNPAALYAHVPPSYWDSVGGLNTALLQFTDRASIAGKSTDCSAFAGTRDELIALLGTTGGEGAELTPEEHGWLSDLHDRVCRLETAWAGGGTDASGTPYDLRLLANRANVETHQGLLTVQALNAKIDALILALAGK